MFVTKTLTENEIITDIFPYQEMLTTSILSGWDDYLTKNYSKFARSIHKARTRANIVHDHIVCNVKIQFQNVKNVSFIETRGIFFINIRNKYLIRFKMFDNNIRHKNFQTPHAIAFDSQESLPGIPQGARLIAGYILNSLETAIKNIYLTCPNGSSNQWCWNLAAKTPAKLFDFPVTTTVYDVPHYIQPLENTEETENNDAKKN